MLLFIKKNWVLIKNKFENSFNIQYSIYNINIYIY